MSDEADKIPDDDYCIDCDRLKTECACENVLRCSCGMVSEVCVCANRD